MHLSFLTSEYPHPRVNRSTGIGTSIKNLAEGLVKKMIDTQFIESGLQFYTIKNIKLKGLSWCLTKKKIERLINQLHKQKAIDIFEAPDRTGISSLMKPLFTNQSMANVSYLGSVSCETIKGHIETADVFAFPIFAEALPVSWLEAMAVRKAIVASSIGWVPEVIDDRINGFLVAPKDHQRYADRICKLLDNSDLRMEFGLAAKAKVESYFERKIIATKSVALYDSILNL